MLNNPKTKGRTESSERPIQFQTSTIKPSTSNMKTTISNVSEQFTAATDNTS